MKPCLDSPIVDARRTLRTVTHTLLATLLVVASGCATVTAPSGDGVAAGDAAAGVANGRTSGSLDAIGDVRPGDFVALPEGNTLGVANVRVLDEYTAASGRRCRRVDTLIGDIRIVCQRRNQHWTVTRSLDAATPSVPVSTLLPVVGTIVRDGLQVSPRSDDDDAPSSTPIVVSALPVAAR